MRLAVLAVALLLAGPVGAECAGDCDADGAVRVDELVGLVACALGNAPSADCLACADGDGSGALEVHELVAAVTHALDGCTGTRFTLRVYLREFADEGYQIGACVGLQPLGRTAQDSGSGYVFADLPPGHYEVNPALACGGVPCNPFGCWPGAVPVEIVDRDVTLTVSFAACRQGADCGNTGALCIAPDEFLCGVCRDDPDDCAADGECDAGQVCIPTAVRICPCDGSPALVCAPACGTDTDCAPGEHCQGAGRCVRPGCAADADCGGDVCVRGHCYDRFGSCQLPPP
jgi:hypothetical protein